MLRLQCKFNAPSTCKFNVLLYSTLLLYFFGGGLRLIKGSAGALFLGGATPGGRGGRATVVPLAISWARSAASRSIPFLSFG